METGQSNERLTVTDLGWADWPQSLASHDTRSGTPSLVVGWKGEFRMLATRDAGDQPATVVRFAHQHGGHACVQATMLGTIFPLEFPKQPIRNVAELVEVFSILSSDGSGPIETQRTKLARIVPGLEHSWLSAGVALDDAAKRRWEVALRRWLDVPPVRSGLEALLGFGTEVEMVLGWSAAAFALKDERLLGTAVEYQRSDLDGLRRIGRTLELGEPGLWLVWENSD